MTPRELPLLYSAPMVLACLSGRKTQTRRIPPRALWGDVAAMLAWGRKRYGDPGDVLRIRERWAPHADQQDAYRSSVPWSASIYYAADGALWSNVDARAGRDWYIPANDPVVSRWRPSIHMPMWASRISRRRVQELRVQHIQDISDEDARAEGIPEHMGGCGLLIGCSTCGGCERYRDRFSRKWDEINGHRAAWAENPPVIVVSHEAHQAEEARAA